jgi:hypothetical protein
VVEVVGLPLSAVAMRAHPIGHGGSQAAKVEDIDLGEIRGKAGEPSMALVSVQMGVFDRVGMRVVFSSTLDGVKLSGFRGRGDSVEVAIGIEARRSGTGTFRVQCVGRERLVTGVGKVHVERGEPVLMEIR